MPKKSVDKKAIKAASINARNAWAVNKHVFDELRGLVRKQDKSVDDLKRKMEKIKHYVKEAERLLPELKKALDKLNELLKKHGGNPADPKTDLAIIQAANLHEVYSAGYERMKAALPKFKQLVK